MNDGEFVDLVNELAALPESYHFAASTGSASQLDLPEDQRGPPDIIFKAIDQLNPNSEKGLVLKCKRGFKFNRFEPRVRLRSGKMPIPLCIQQVRRGSMISPFCVIDALTNCF